MVPHAKDGREGRVCSALLLTEIKLSFSHCDLGARRDRIVVSRLLHALFVLIVPSFNPDKDGGNLKMTPLF